MPKRLTKILTLITFITFSGFASSGNPLVVHCRNLNGKLIAGHYITNVNIKKNKMPDSLKSSIVQILYDDNWYEVTGEAAINILSTAEIGLLFHREFDVCVSSDRLLGIQFTRVL